ncbi:TerB family tellurite resistance protein [Mucilaginibacter celer]|uniref:TerB family tellurite resistance protein n=1 Tax=Mucilaginibacter celer TaxID=2305508 RepID=UPI001FE1E2F8|nr:TerB family tellurite resistance protein [Mucilaginibacter celer]
MNRSIKTLALAFILAAALLKPGTIKAQEQEMQQLLLDIEKLTQMKSILSDMKTGYQIYQQGYGTISALSKGNFDLHSLYLSGLLAVSPAVRNYGRVAEILLMQSRLVSEYKEKSGLFRKSGSFSISELNYMGTVYARLVSETLNDLEELTNIVTAGKLRMSDAERIRGIDRIYSASSDKLGFLRSFNDQGIILSLQRTKEAGDTRSLKQLYGLNN